MNPPPQFVAPREAAQTWSDEARNDIRLAARVIAKPLDGHESLEMPPGNDPFKDLVLVLLPTVEDDAERAIETAIKTGDLYDRRMAYRAVFAALEGSLYVARQLVLSGVEAQRHRYSDAEVAMLKEENYLLADNGTAHTRPRFLRMEANMRFVMEMVVREANIPLDVGWSSDGWGDVKASLEMRNRVTHPRSTTDLEVSEEELGRLNSGFVWARHNLFRTMARALLAARFKIYGLLNEILPDRITSALDEADPEADALDSHATDKDDLGRLVREGLAVQHGGRTILSLTGRTTCAGGRIHAKPPNPWPHLTAAKWIG